MPAAPKHVLDPEGSGIGESFLRVPAGSRVRLGFSDLIQNKLFGRLRRRVNLAIDEHSSRVRSASILKLPGDLVALSRQLRPFRGLIRILLKPEPAVLVSERS